MERDLRRFIAAQEKAYELAEAEIRSGQKQGHWMWYIFPQFQGLGFSDTSRYYAIQDLAEARAYLNHPVLGKRLREISAALLIHQRKSAREIFGTPDDLKLNSCMTLFASVDTDTDNVFRKVIDLFYSGQADQRTLDLISR